MDKMTRFDLGSTPPAPPTNGMRLGSGPPADPPPGRPAADVPAADVPAADVPAADVPAADVPTADVPAADVPAADVPAADPPAGSSAGDPIDDQLGDPVELAAEHLRQFVAQTETFARRRVEAAQLQADDVRAQARDAAAQILRGARREAVTVREEAQREAATLREEAHREAADVLETARGLAARELGEARRTASELVRSAVAQARAPLAEARTGDAAPATGEPGQLVDESSRLVERLRALHLELADVLRLPGRGAAPDVDPAADLLGIPAPQPAEARHVGTRRPGAWGRAVHRRRRLMLALAALVAVLCSVWGPGVVGKLTGSGFAVEGSQSQRAVQEISRTVGRQSTDVVVLYSSPGLTVDSLRYRDAVRAVVDRLPARDVASAATVWTTNSYAFVSGDRKSTYLALRLTGADDDANAEILRRLRPNLTLDPEVGTTAVGGPAAVNDEINDQVGKDLTKAETLSAPLLMVLLVIVFGSVAAASLPLLVGAFTVVGSFVALRLITGVTDVSVFAINIVTLMGLGLSIDYALLVVSRYREELRAGQDGAEALARTLSTAGRSVLVSATTVSVGLAGLAFFPVVFLRSMAFGGVAAVAVAALVSVTVLPAVLAVLGHRVDALRVPWPRRRADPSGSSAWARFARVVMRRPVLFATAVAVLMLTLAAPVLDVRFGGIDIRQLPQSAPSRVVDDRLAKDFPNLRLDPIQLLVQGGSGAGSSVAARAATLPGVTGVRTVASSRDATLYEVSYAGAPTGSRARAVVAALRSDPAPAGAQVLVGGPSAEYVDLRAAVVGGLWKMAVLTVLATFVLLVWAFGSFVLPIKALLMNALVVSACLGVVVLVFQDGHGSGLLGFAPTGEVELTQPILVLAILFGLSTDYEVFLLSRVREAWDATGDNTEAVAQGMQRTGPIITSAAALILVVIAAFSTSQVLFVKLIGIGMAVAILLDSTVVRGVLVPATMRLLGRWNWWAPAPFLRVWERHRPPSEGGAPVGAAP